MIKIVPLLVLLCTLASCENSVELLKVRTEAVIVPTPKEVTNAGSSVLLDHGASINYSDEISAEMIEYFVEDVDQLLGYEFQIRQESGDAEFVIALDSTIDDNGYIVDIDDGIYVSAATENGIAYALQSILQISDVMDGKLLLPQVIIKDFPDASFIGLMIDLARAWYPIDEVKKLIDLAAFYKVNYLHLHFTDYQSYTFPSKLYPNLATSDRSYSWEELHEMESYSQAKGVTIIPEIKVPGHSSQFVKKYPEIFAIDDTLSNPWIINMGNPQVYSALESIFNEVSSVFKSSPYLHIGGDETILTSIMDDAKTKEYIIRNGIKNDPKELYRHFLVRMNEIVKAQGKQMCVWEGFEPNGEIEIPRDMIVFEFETNRYLPNELINDGYTVVNCSWKPLYVVNQKKWSPETIYDWSLFTWSNWWKEVPSYNTNGIPTRSSPVSVVVHALNSEMTPEL